MVTFFLIHISDAYWDRAKAATVSIHREVCEVNEKTGTAELRSPVPESLASVDGALDVFVTVSGVVAFMGLDESIPTVVVPVPWPPVV